MLETHNGTAQIFNNSKKLEEFYKVQNQMIEYQLMSKSGWANSTQIAMLQGDNVMPPWKLEGEI